MKLFISFGLLHPVLFLKIFSISPTFFHKSLGESMIFQFSKFVTLEVIKKKVSMLYGSTLYFFFEKIKKKNSKPMP